MKRLFFYFSTILISFFALISCASSYSSTSAPSQTANLKNAHFYILQDEKLNLASVVQDELIKMGFLDARVIETMPQIKSTSKPEGGSGTGFFVAPNLVLTNEHVVHGFTDVSIGKSGNTYDGKVIALNQDIDLALISISTTSSKYFELLPANSYNTADSIFVLGYPLTDILGENIKVTNGIINSITGMGDDPNEIQISAPIQPGNSGGPVMTADYKVVGIVRSKLSDSYVIANKNTIAQNVNFAIKSDLANFLFSDKIGKNDPSNFVSNVSEAMDATVQITTGKTSKSSHATQKKEYCIDMEYKYNFDLIHFTLDRITVNCVDLSTGQTIAQSSFEGTSVSSAKKITRDRIRDLINKIR